MSRRQRKTREKRRRRAASASGRVRQATISGSLLATAVVGLAADAEPADAQGFDATLVKDINAGVADSELKYLTNLGGTAFFRATDGPDDGTPGTTHGNELWRSDGTEAGTQLVKDISPTGNGGLFGITVFDDKLFFGANDDVNGMELWSSDGTEAGTQLFQNINAIPGAGSSPTNFAESNGYLFFNAVDGPDNGTTQHGGELWKSDGTPGGAVLVEDISDVGTTLSSYPARLTDLDGTLVFTAYDATGRELWRSEGTALNTYQLADIDPGDDTPPGGGPDSSNPLGFAQLGDELLFSANNGSGYELWKTDGTMAGTGLVKDINANSGLGSNPQNLVNHNGTVFFAATDGPDNGTTHGFELWKTDGTGPGTQLVADISATSDSVPNELTSVGDDLLFGAHDGPDNGTTHGQELWRSDGTPGGTQLVKDIASGTGSYPSRLHDFNGTLFFSAEEPSTGAEVWRSDGTEAGTQLVEDINPGMGSSSPKYFEEIGGDLFFAAEDPTHGRELWRAFALPAATTPPVTTPAAPTPPAQPAKKCKKGQKLKKGKCVKKKRKKGKKRK
jgi:ELWxxDGT repeat protein